MHIIFEHAENNYYEPINAAYACLPNAQCTFWVRKRKPTIDMIDEMKPEMVFVYNESLDPSLVLAKQIHNFKLISLVRYNQKNIDDYAHIVDLFITDNPNLNNEKVEYIKPFANVAQIAGAKYTPNYKSDISIILTEPFNETVKSYLDFITTNFQVKIYGHKAPYPHYLGEIDLYERANIIKSSKVLLGFTSNFEQDAKFLKVRNLVVDTQGDSPLELIEKLQKLLQRQEVIQESVDTSFEVIENICDKLNMPNILEDIRATKEEVLC